MSRGLWFVAGTAAGVYATSKVRRAAEALTVDGMHDRLSGWFAGARVLTAEVRAGYAEKEQQLRVRLGDVPGDTVPPIDDNVRSLPARRLSLTDSRATDPTPHRTIHPSASEQRRDHH